MELKFKNNNESLSSMMAEVVKRYFIHATDNFVLVFVFSYTSGD